MWGTTALFPSLWPWSAFLLSGRKTAGKSSVTVTSCIGGWLGFFEGEGISDGFKISTVPLLLFLIMAKG